MGTLRSAGHGMQGPDGASDGSAKETHQPETSFVSGASGKQIFTFRVLHVLPPWLSYRHTVKINNAPLQDPYPLTYLITSPGLCAWSTCPLPRAASMRPGIQAPDTASRSTKEWTEEAQTAHHHEIQMDCRNTHQPAFSAWLTRPAEFHTFSSHGQEHTLI